MTSLTAELGAAAPVALLLIVIAAVLFRPGKLPEGAYAAAGGAVAVASGIVPAGQAGRVVEGTLGILGFFLGMMVMTVVAEQAGVFTWATTLAVRLSAGSAQRLLLAVFGVGTLITALLSNDATALLLTPLVLAVTEQLGLPALPYALACA
ncbi:MAG TPA: SLC13 family permease, partial [Chloroflexota bacterium]|nr:SLC13 family permease [Chloroflexota bacterium]